MIVANHFMHAIPTILQIIFYIAAMLAPESATKMTLSPNPDEAKQFEKTASGSWRLVADASEWKTNADSVIIEPRRAGGKEERRRVASLIDKAPNLANKLRTHDWTMTISLSLSGGLTIDKPEEGFRIHAPKEEDTPAVDFRVLYSN